MEERGKRFWGNKKTEKMASLLYLLRRGCGWNELNMM